VLVIRRRPGQSILIGQSVEIEIIEAGPGRVKLGITAPMEVLVLRKEIGLTRDQNLSAARGVCQEAVRNLAGRMGPDWPILPRQNPGEGQQIGGGRDKP
jgi:carbon storage regulator